MAGEEAKTLDQLAREFYTAFLNAGGGSVTPASNVAVTNFPASTEIANDSGNPIPVNGSVNVNNIAGALFNGDITDRVARALGLVRDYFNDAENLSDVAGTGAVADFTFTSPVQLAFLRPRGGDVRFSTVGTPTASFGAYAGDGESTPIPRQLTTFKVYIPTGVTVTVWGFRYV